MPPRLHHGRYDLAVAGAAAEHAAQRILHFEFRRLRVLFEQRSRGHQQAGGADAALRRAMLQEGGLQRRQSPVGKTLDCPHRAALDRGRRHQASAGRRAVDEHRAGAAIARVAANLGAGEPEIVAQHGRQPRHGMDRHGDGRAVHFERDGVPDAMPDAVLVRVHAATLPAPASSSAPSSARSTISRAAARR